MEKIPTLYERDWEGDRSRVTDVVHSGCEWVIEGEGIATRKYDGTCVMLDDDGAWWARREVKDGKTPPPGFKSMGHDHITLKNIGWEPIEQSGFAKFFQQAIELSAPTIPGTYELCGPKVQGNPEGFTGHVLIEHADADRYVVPRTFEGLEEFLGRPEINIEGFVFKHEDRRRQAKIKGKDFGLRRGT